jgi:LPXTG-site transpeptidase (sortase) family protein
LNTADDAQDSRNRIQIEKINLEVPFFTGGVGELEKGAWHRFPERGNPEKGGNFILSAHRFRIANNPALTKVRSPFYNLDKLQVGDTMRVFYDGQWYDYTVTKTYSVKPNEIQIEAPSKEAKLTLYSCSLGGSSDGRIVIEAVTKTQPPASESPTATPSPTPKPSTTQSPKVTPKSSTQKKTAPKAMPGFVFPTPPQRP